MLFGPFLICCLQVVASQDWPEVTKYAGLVCAQAHRQELIQDLYKTWHDPQRGTVTGGMVRYLSWNSLKNLVKWCFLNDTIDVFIFLYAGNS
jgi:hypothetical protein